MHLVATLEQVNKMFQKSLISNTTDNIALYRYQWQYIQSIYK